MSGWYWLLWAILTVVNTVMWFVSRQNLRAALRLLDPDTTPGKTTAS